MKDQTQNTKFCRKKKWKKKPQNNRINVRLKLQGAYQRGTVQSRQNYYLLKICLDYS